MPNPQDGTLLVNSKTHAPEFVPTEKIQEALASKTHYATSETNVRLAGGGMEPLDEGGQRDLEAKSGSIVSGVKESNEARTEAYESQFDSADYGVSSFAQGLADAVSFGFVVDHSIEGKKAREHHGVSGFLGNVAGTVATLGLSAPGKAIVAAGEGIGKLAAGTILRGAEGKLAQAATRATVEAATGAIIGTVMSTTHQLGDAIIEDKPFSAEAVAHEAGLNALFGFGIGGAAGLLSKGGASKGVLQSQGGILDPKSLKSAELLKHHADAIDGYQRAIGAHADNVHIMEAIANDHGFLSAGVVKGRRASVKAAQDAHEALKEFDLEKILAGQGPKNLEKVNKYVEAYDHYQTSLEKLNQDMVHRPGEADWVNQTPGGATQIGNKVSGPPRPASKVPANETAGVTPIDETDIIGSESIEAPAETPVETKVQTPNDWLTTGHKIVGQEAPGTASLRAIKEPVVAPAKGPAPDIRMSSEQALDIYNKNEWAPGSRLPNTQELDALIAARDAVKPESWDQVMARRNVELDAELAKRPNPAKELAEIQSRKTGQGAALEAPVIPRSPVSPELPKIHSEAENAQLLNEVISKPQGKPGNETAKGGSIKDNLAATGGKPVIEGAGTGPVGSLDDLNKLAASPPQVKNAGIGNGVGGKRAQAADLADQAEAAYKAHKAAASKAVNEGYVKQWIRDWVKINEKTIRVSPGDEAAARMKSAIDGMQQVAGTKLNSTGGLNPQDLLGMPKAVTSMGERIQQIYALRQLAKIAADSARGVKVPTSITGKVLDWAKRKVVTSAGSHLLGGVLGAHFGGPLGFYIGSQLMGSGVKSIASAGAAAGRLATKLAEASSVLLSGGRSVAIARAATRAVTDNVAHEYDHQGPIKDFVKRVETIHSLAKNPEALRAQVASNLGNIQYEIPEVAAGIIEHAVNRVQRISARMPVFMYNQLGGVINPAASRVRQGCEYENAANSLDSIIDAVKSGTASRIQIDALRECYPEAHMELTKGILADNIKLAKLSPDGLRIPEMILGTRLGSMGDPMSVMRHQTNWMSANQANEDAVASQGKPANGANGKPQAYKLGGAPTANQVQGTTGRAPGN